MTACNRHGVRRQGVMREGLDGEVVAGVDFKSRREQPAEKASLGATRLCPLRSIVFLRAILVAPYRTSLVALCHII